MKFLFNLFLSMEVKKFPWLELVKAVAYVLLGWLGVGSVM